MAATLLSNAPVANWYDIRQMMEYPFFPAAKRGRTGSHQCGAVTIEIRTRSCDIAVANIYDCSIIQWIVSKIRSAVAAGEKTEAKILFTPPCLLEDLGWGKSQSSYKRLWAALTRLANTQVKTNLDLAGAGKNIHEFYWLNSWCYRHNRSRLASSGDKARKIEIVLPWQIHRRALNHQHVLSIDDEYFRLKGGIQRLLYRVARKHAGRQVAGWCLQISTLKDKVGSVVRPSDFAVFLRRAVKVGVPGYRLTLREATDGGRSFLHMVTNDSAHRAPLSLPNGRTLIKNPKKGVGGQNYTPPLPYNRNPHSHQKTKTDLGIKGESSAVPLILSDPADPDKFLNDNWRDIVASMKGMKISEP